MASELHIAGLSELDKALKEFSAKVEGNIVRGGLRAGTRVFLKRAQQYVPVQSGELRKSLRVSTRTKRGNVSATLKAGNAKAFYAHMVEFGTAAHLIQADTGNGKNAAARINRRTRKAGALSVGTALVEQVVHPGSAPKPFMRPAFDGGEQEAIKAMADYIRTRIEKEKLK